MGSFPALGHSSADGREGLRLPHPGYVCQGFPGSRVSAHTQPTADGEPRCVSGLAALGASPELYLKSCCSNRLFSLFLRGTLLWKDAQTL